MPQSSNVVHSSTARFFSFPFGAVSKTRTRLVNEEAWPHADRWFMCCTETATKTKKMHNIGLRFHREGREASFCIVHSARTTQHEVNGSRCDVTQAKTETLCRQETCLLQDNQLEQGIVELCNQLEHNAIKELACITLVRSILLL